MVYTYGPLFSKRGPYDFYEGDFWLSQANNLVTFHPPAHSLACRDCYTACNSVQPRCLNSFIHSLTHCFILLQRKQKILFQCSFFFSLFFKPYNLLSSSILWLLIFSLSHKLKIKLK